MLSSPRPSCQVDYSYVFQGVTPDTQTDLAAGFTGWDPPMFSYTGDLNYVGSYTVDVIGNVNDVENSFTFTLSLKTPCDQADFVQIVAGPMTTTYDYIVTDYSVMAPFEITLADATVVTSPIQHDFCGPIKTEVFFQNTQLIEVDTITPAFDVLNYYESQQQDCIFVKKGQLCTDTFVRTVEIFAKNPDLIGTQRFTVRYSLQEQSMIETRVNFEVTF